MEQADIASPKLYFFVVRGPTRTLFRDVKARLRSPCSFTWDAKVSLLPLWGDARKIHDGGSALIWFTAALAWAARCYNEKALETGSAYLTLAHQYLDRYGQLPGAILYTGELQNSLKMITAHVAHATQHAVDNHVEASNAVRSAETELRRYCGLTNWNISGASL